MRVDEVLRAIDTFAPFFLQVEGDNSGLQIGNLEAEVRKLVLCLDLTREVVKESVSKGVNLVITHHPVFYKPVQSITNNNCAAAIEAIENGINVISVHTNFDLSKDGLNDYVAKLLSINKLQPIKPSSEKVFKLATYVPVSHAELVRSALFEAGAGRIGNYSETSFNIEGNGTFKPLKGAKPFIGSTNRREAVREIKIETILREREVKKVLEALRKSHPYEEPAFDLFEIKIKSVEGIGLTGNISGNPPIDAFIDQVKRKLGIKFLRLVKGRAERVTKIALCTGSGKSLLDDVMSQDMDVFVTGDIDYHSALKAKESGLTIIDVDHFESEKFFSKCMKEKLVRAGIEKSLITYSTSTSNPFKVC